MKSKKFRTLAALAVVGPLVLASACSQQAKNEGYTLEELFGAGAGTSSATRAPRGTAKKARKSLGKVPPKYRNPANPEETWTGRGKQPRWLAAYTSEGRNVDEFLIK